MYLRIIVTLNKAVAVLGSHKGEEYNEAFMYTQLLHTVSY